MIDIANVSRKEREELFIVTSRQIGLPEAMIEKDFWICWILNYLFHLCPWAKHFAFKGGTSLSKCYGMIERFSEDIDMVLDWRVLGYAVNEPCVERSRTKQDRFNKEVVTRTEGFLANEFLLHMQLDFGRLLSDDFRLYVDDMEPQTICFSYPRIFGNDSILSIVRLEIGALAAWTPTESTVVTPYVAQSYPNLFTKPSAQVLTVSPERTFWEKVTILHKEAFRVNGRIPPRYSRHYYDLYCMDKFPVKERAYGELELLQQVARFKDRFYYSGSAHYELAKPGTMRLIPPEVSVMALRADYEHMKNMIFGIQPEFDDVARCIKRIESEINSI